MRRLGAATAAAGLVVLALAVPASAATTGSAETTTGQTLTITIDSPAEGSTLSDNEVTFGGHVSLSPPVDGSAGTGVTRVDFQIEGVPTTFFGSSPAADGSWTQPFRSNGPRHFSFIAIAADGTTARADVHVTFPPYETHTYAWPLMKTGTPPFMHVTVSDEYDLRGPTDSGNTVDFYVSGQKVCSATTSNGAASCADPAANLLATFAGGYDAVLVGNAYYASSSDHAGLNTD